jgi:hypothetical protein
MEASPSPGASSCAPNQEHPQYYMDPEGSLPSSQEPPLNPILSEINPVIPLFLFCLRLVLIVTTDLHLGLPSGFFPSGFLVILGEEYSEPLHFTRNHWQNYNLVSFNFYIFGEQKRRL